MFGFRRARLFRKTRGGVLFTHPNGMQVELRGLTRRDADCHAGHLKRLSPDDRHARFQHAMKDGAIDAYSKRLDWERALIFGAFVDGTLRGVGELLPEGSNAEMELAVSIEPEFQHASIGRLLVAAMLTAARVSHKDEIHMVFLRGNAGMRALARDIGAEMHTEDGVTEGAVHLSPAA